VAKTQNYSAETREKAVRLVREHAKDYPSEFAAMKAVARGHLDAWGVVV
jgi:transposase-like protein